jgi:transposase
MDAPASIGIDVPKWGSCIIHLSEEGASAMKITTIGIDLAKSVFQVHGVDERGRVVLRQQLRRAQMVEFFTRLAPCLIGMEACGSAHHWARTLQGLGHEVRLMAPQYVKPYRKSQKNDANDAEAICEAVARPSMRFVAIKTVAQQSVLALHRARTGALKMRTALSNQMRGLLAEFGLIVPLGLKSLRERAVAIVADSGNGLDATMRGLIDQLLAQLRQIDGQVQDLERQIKTQARANEACQRVQAIPGIGPITASAAVAELGDGGCFAAARQVPAALGLVPRQHSSGGRTVLLGITKRGDAYLRYLFIHGARAVIKSARNKPPGQLPPWLAAILARKHPNVAAVALAARNARIVWALLHHNRPFDSHYVKPAAV